MVTNLQRLEYFVSVAQTLSFTEAAKQHFVSQTAISQQITTLEEETGVKLFTRTKRSVKLTPAGRCLYESAPDMLQKFEEMMERVRACDDGRNALKVCYTGPIERLMLKTVYHAVRERYPNILLNLEFCTQTDAKQELLRGLCDVVLSAMDEFQEENVHQVTVATNPLRLCAAKNSRLCSRETVMRDDLHDERAVILTKRAADSGHDHAKKLMLRLGFEEKNIIETSTIEDQLLLIELGQAVSVLPAVDALGEGSLMFLPLEGLNGSHCISASFRDKTPLIDAFLSCFAND